MLICTPSVMHSGTHLLRHFILKDFRMLGTKQIEGVLYQTGGHFINSALPNLLSWFDKRDQEYPLICPMRHPARIRASFLARGRQLIYDPENKRNSYPNEGSDYESQWKNLIATNEKYPIYFIHVDDIENRDKQVRELGKILDMFLTCDWPINDLSNAKKGTHTLEITPELEEQVPTWIMEYYNEITRVVVQDVPANVA